MGCANWYDRHLTASSRGAECRRMALEEMAVAVDSLRETLTGLFDTVDEMLATATTSATAE